MTRNQPTNQPTSPAAVISSLIAVFILIIGAAIYGWSTLPQHEARANRTQAMIPYLEAQQEIAIAEEEARAVLRMERALKTQGLLTAVNWAALIFLIVAITGSGVYGLYVSRSHAQRIARGHQLPVIQEAGDLFIIGDGSRAWVFDRLTGQHTAIFTKLPASPARAAIMGRLKVAQALAAGAAAVAKETKDPAAIDFLMGQLERVTHESGSPPIIGTAQDFEFSANRDPGPAVHQGRTDDHE